MRKLIAILVLSLIGLVGGFAQESADTNQLEIVWDVPTNCMATSVWTYKIIPQTFAPAVVSNLMIFGGFTEKDESHIGGQTPFSRYFNSQDGTRKLGVIPTYGYIFYEDSTAEVKGRQKPVGVPSEEEAYQLGLDYLQKLGVDRSQLVTVGESNKLKTIKIVGGRSWFDKTLGTNVEVNYMRGVDFIRRVNGIDLTQGGADFEFGNNGKITRLEVLWKGLEPYELHSTRTSDQLIKELRSGKGKWTPITPRSIKKVTIYDARPLYRGFPVREDDEHKFLEPFVRLETHVDTGSTNIAAGFDCPIIDETKL